jgi:SAM-dependent methyltransferase
MTMHSDTQTLTSPARTSYRCTHCLLCRSAQLTLALPLARSAIGNDYLAAPRPQESYPLSLYLCRQCGNVQIEEVVHPDILFRSYTYATQHSLGLVKHFQHAAADIASRAEAPAGSLVIDIGSNDGSLLMAYRAQGYRVLGIDPAVGPAELATAAGIETVPDYFTAPLAEELVERHGQATIISANNVFAHSDRLPEMADGIRRLLAPTGIFVFEVSYLLDLIQKMLFDTVYHEHLCYHSVRSLQSFFQRHDLELIDVERLPTKGGSLRGMVRQAGGPRKASSSVARWIEWESILDLHNPATFPAWSRRIEAAKDQFVSLIDRLRAQNRRIAGYGASPTVTTLLHQFDLGKRLEFLVDDNPVKQNTYSPGHHIPVYPSDALYSRGVDVVAILAWNYAQPIQARHQAFLENGGRFLVPLPSLQVL